MRVLALGQGIGLEQVGAHHRGERQRDQHRQHHGDAQHPRELMEQAAGDAGHQQQRQEHRHQHGGGGDHREGDLRGTALGGDQRWLAQVDAALHVLHHHDGIVHQQADRQHHREHGQHVHREAPHRQHAEGTQQHHRHGDGRDQGGAEVLQEDQHHQDHQQHRFEQGLAHFLDRDLDEGGAVVRREPGHAGREAGLQLVHLAAHRFGNVQGP
ncbi:hypothetical protein G6F55_013453 [Rhizopus delemar]|nr:hypothetical protein G6F55_013453 [Rhizopus delemar]